MPQIFHHRTNTLARLSLAGGLILLVALAWGFQAVYWSPYATGAGVALEQPVPFSHKHHVGGLGIDCRYCHSAVEDSRTAGIPATDTCMTCHSQLWTDAAMLAPVRRSLAEGIPLRWNRLHDLPDFVYFDHGVHVQKGIGCSTCHGRVDQMALTHKVETLYMKWCLECHRQPERFIRPREAVFEMEWAPPANRPWHGRELVERYRVNTKQLTDCSICHR